MKLTWLGHSGFRLEAHDRVVLIDPWLTGNPMITPEQAALATAGATDILLSHGHGDHAGDVVRIARELSIRVAGQFDLMSLLEKNEGISVTGFNKGGTIRLGDVSVTMVNAVHSSTLPGDKGPLAAGSEAGFIIRAEGRCIYFSGDTDIMADMGWIGEYYAPDIGILSAGGHFTMDMKAATWASKKYFDFDTMIPCHFRTFPILEQSCQTMIDGLPGVRVIDPTVMEPIEL